MKVLMFGWEYPPHVFGGLATANFGISEGLYAQGDIETTLCLPHPFGDEDRTYANIVAMNKVPIVYREMSHDHLKELLGNLMDTDLYYKLRNNIYADFSEMYTNEVGAMEFAGGYPSNLNEEINNYSIIAGVVARTMEYDIIHAHDWLTFPAGIHAKQISGKPLCIHVHATDFDRSRGNVNPTVYSIEKNYAFEKTDVLILTDIYAAREKNIYKISSDKLAETIKETHTGKDVRYIKNFDEIAEAVQKEAKPGDLVITMGAGDVFKIGDMILEAVK